MGGGVLPPSLPTALTLQTPALLSLWSLSPPPPSHSRTQMPCLCDVQHGVTLPSWQRTQPGPDNINTAQPFTL